jgi:predicted nucleic acid-binding protein
MNPAATPAVKITAMIAMIAMITTMISTTTLGICSVSTARTTCVTTAPRASPPRHWAAHRVTYVNQNDSTGAIIIGMATIVVDTNVLVASLLRNGGIARAVLRACLRADYQPVLGPALFSEYEAVLARSALFAGSVLTAKERGDVFDGFLSRCRWVEMFYAWRPNLPDEADSHLIELGVAAQADAIVTRNLRDVARGELKFPRLKVLTPEQCLEVFPCQP